MISIWSLRLGAHACLARPPDSGGPGAGSTYHLDSAKWDAVCKSIGAYLDYAKKNYGVEPKLFSFNETDIATMCSRHRRNTEAIKAARRVFRRAGHNGQDRPRRHRRSTGIGFIDDAMGRSGGGEIPWRRLVSLVARRHGGAVHPLGAAPKIELPVLVGEGGMDSDAYRYQALLLEPWYALVEISEYIDICRLSQPLTILRGSYGKLFRSLADATASHSRRHNGSGSSSSSAPRHRRGRPAHRVRQVRPRALRLRSIRRAAHLSCT